MPYEKVSKDTLIDCALILFCAKGYYNTSMQDIANACHIKKPSIYHYFNSKKALLETVIERLMENFNGNVLSIASLDITPYTEKLNRICSASHAFFDQLNGGYFINTLVFDQTHDTETARKLLKAFFSHWINVLVTIIEETHGQHAQAVAEDYVAQVKGALFLSKATGNKKIVDRAFQRITDS